VPGLQEGSLGHNSRRRGICRHNYTFLGQLARVPASDMVGKENEGFKMILHGMNAERILIGAETLGLGYAALRKAAIYAGERNVFWRPIGKNQAIQHPLADSWMKLEAARFILYHAARMYDQIYAGEEYANSAKYLAAEAAFQACERAVMVHGGMGYAKEYYVERYTVRCSSRESLLLVGR
jgi:alkylation response protein AidB-like acyl-CoA dehydrogenase